MLEHAKILPFRRVDALSHAGHYDVAAFPRFAKEFANPGLKPDALKADAAVAVRRDDIQIQ
jgi:hypothetical protein